MLANTFKALFAFAVLVSFAQATDPSDTGFTKTQIELKIPFTFGEHKVKATTLNGHVTWSDDKTQIKSAEFVLPMASLKNDDKTLICHLQSSLSLDYQASDFPKKHVCEKDKLPDTGKNAPKYSDISARLVTPFTMGDKVAKILWSIHGVELEQDVPVEVTLSEDRTQFTLKGSWQMKRSDFNIIVKKFLFIDASNKLPVTIHIEGLVK